ncbi:hypothetical protein MUP32_00740 [Candidatus Microgenomates bacterium]|nr:hypothetical protein [Candidatus Microgenomates bacterium]
MVTLSQESSPNLPTGLDGLIKIQASLGSHVHLEGSCVSPEQANKVESTGKPWPDFLARLQTGSIQEKLIRACLNPEYPGPKMEEPPFYDLIKRMEQDSIPLSPEVISMMSYTYQLGKQTSRILKLCGDGPTTPVMVSPHNASVDINGFTTLSAKGITPSLSAKYGGDKFPPSFQPLTLEQYLSALCLGLGRPVVVSLRREQSDAEGWYLTNPQNPKTLKFVKQLSDLKNAGLIAGVDIAGDENNLPTAEMTGFLGLLRGDHPTDNLISSIHAGEEGIDRAAYGLGNIVDALDLDVPEIGHALSLWFLLAADENDPALAQQRTEIDQIAAKKLQLKPGAKYADIAKSVLAKAKEKGITFQLCMACNQALGLVKQNEVALDISNHPFIRALRKFGPDIIPLFPRIIISVDNYSVTGKSAPSQILELIPALLKPSAESADIKWSSSDIYKLFKQITNTSIRPERE